MEGKTALQITGATDKHKQPLGTSRSAFPAVPAFALLLRNAPTTYLQLQIPGKKQGCLNLLANVWKGAHVAKMRKQKLFMVESIGHIVKVKKSNHLGPDSIKICLAFMPSQAGLEKSIFWNL